MTPHHHVGVGMGVADDRSVDSRADLAREEIGVDLDSLASRPSTASNLQIDLEVGHGHLPMADRASRSSDSEGDAEEVRSVGSATTVNSRAGLIATPGGVRGASSTAVDRDKGGCIIS